MYIHVLYIIHCMSYCLYIDLGIGVKVAGGVKCDKCGRLHTVITDVTDNLPVHLYRGIYNRVTMYDVYTYSGGTSLIRM